MPNELDLLKTIIERGFDDLQRRLDEQSKFQTERHRDNTGRLDRNEAELRTIAARTIEHSQQIETLFQRGMPVTVIGLRWYLGFSVAAVGVLIAALHAWK